MAGEGLQPCRFRQIDAETIAPALVTTGHFSGSMAQLLVDRQAGHGCARVKTVLTFSIPRTAFIFSAMSLGRPARLPLSISAFFTHSLRVCAEQPIFAAIDDTAAQRDACSAS